jgi:hypothetical protein
MSRFVTVDSGTYFSTPDVNLLDADTAHLHQSIAAFVIDQNLTSLALSTDEPMFGDNSLKAVCDGVGTAIFKESSVDLHPVSSSTEYSLSCDALAAAGLSNDWNIQIFWYNSSSGFISTSQGANITVTDAGVVRLFVTATSPGTAAFVRIFVVSVGTPSATEAYYFGKFALVAGADTSFVPSLDIQTDPTFTKDPAGITAAFAASLLKVGDGFAGDAVKVELLDGVGGPAVAVFDAEDPTTVGDTDTWTDAVTGREWTVVGAGAVLDSTGTVAVTGTAVAGGVLESEIVTGSETIILTVTDDTWVATVGDDNGITDALIAGIDSDGAEAGGWDIQVKGNMVFGDVTRTSATVVTIILAAEAAYAITSDETITVTVPATALTDGIEKTGSPTFDVTNEGVTHAVTITDSVGIADTTAPIKTVPVMIAETVGIADTTSPVKTVPATITDVVGIADEVSRAVAASRTITDAVGVSDNVASVKTIPVTITDSVGLVDGTARAIEILRTVTDSIGLTDTTVPVKTIPVIVIDSVGITDATTPVKTVSVVITDAVGISDVTAPVKTVPVTVTDVVGIGDAAVAAKTVPATISDSIGITDVTDFIKTILIVVVDSIGITDTVTRIADARRTVTETLGITDETLRAVTISRTVTDALGITDAASGAITTVVTGFWVVDPVASVAAPISHTRLGPTS